MPQDFLFARIPEDDSTLPYLLRIPLGDEGGELRVSDLAPATAPSTAEVRAWAKVHGLAVADLGRLSAEVIEAVRRRSG